MSDNQEMEHSQGFVAKVIALASLVAIALGGFNDTSDAIGKIYDFSLSQFTDIPSTNKLEKLYVNASAEILTETLGAPVYLKKTSTGDQVHYYRDDRFIVSSIIKDNYIAALLIFPESGFEVDTSNSPGGANLLINSFSAIESIINMKSNFSREVVYYIEENEGGKYQYLHAYLSGFSDFNQALQGRAKDELATLVDKTVMGEDVSENVANIRELLKPNFFGYTTLPLEIVEQAILTNSEYQLISGV